MKFKHILFLLFFGLLSSCLFAQKNAKKAEKSLKAGNLDKAEEFIQLAVTDGSEKVKARTWYIYGKVMNAMAFAPRGASKDEEYIGQAARGWEYATKIAERNSAYYSLSKQEIEKSWNAFFEEGVTAFRKNNYARAKKNFRYMQLVKPQDTTGYLYHAQAANRMEDYEAVAASYRKLIELDYPNPLTYDFLATVEGLYLGNNAAALAVIEKGLQKFPENIGLQRKKIDFLKKTGQLDYAIMETQQLLDKNPSDPRLWFYMAGMAEKDGNNIDAEKFYKKSLSINSNVYAPNYFLGTLFFNRASEILTELNKTEDYNEFKAKEAEMRGRAEVYLEKALPYFNKAVQVDPSAIETWRVLKNTYLQLGNMEKAKEAKRKIELLTGS